MPTLSPAYVANTVVRMFLARIGATYDRQRGMKPYSKLSIGTILRDEFGHCCCYCELPLTDAAVDEDHLIPTNKSTAGLHAWGNVVPACKPCNKRKHYREWRFFLREISTTDDEFHRRASRIEEFQRKYRYAPAVGLEIVAGALHKEVSDFTVTLMDRKIKEAEALIARLAEIEPPDKLSPQS